MRFTELQAGQRLTATQKVQLRRHLSGVPGLVVSDASVFFIAGHETQVGEAFSVLHVPVFGSASYVLEYRPSFANRR